MTESSGKRGSSQEKLIAEAEAFRGSSDQYAEFIVELGDALAATRQGIDEAALSKVIRPLIFQYNQERITLKTFASAVVAWLKGGAR